MAGNPFDEVIKDLPRIKIVSRPAQTIEETRDPLTIYSAASRSLGEIADEMVKRARSAGLIKE